MPTGLNDSFIYQDFEHQLTITLDKGSTPKKAQLALAEILVQLSYIYRVISDFRISAGLERLFKYSSISSLLNSINREMSDEAIIASSTIVTHYRLPREWIGSFYVAALTNIFPVPSESQISIILPKNMIKGLSITELESIFNRPLVPDSGTLLIEIPNKTTINQIYDFLRNNKALLDSYLDNLPVVPSIKTERRVMLVGQATWFVFQDQPQASWNEVLTELERLWGTNNKRLPKLPDDIQKLKILYRRYLDTLSGISNIKS